MGTTKPEIGGRIKQALDTSGHKQKHLAAALGITEASVSSYMKGNSLPTAAGFAVLSELTNTSIDWLITGKDPPPPKPDVSNEDLLAMLANRNGLVEKVCKYQSGQVSEETATYGLIEDPAEKAWVDFYRAAEPDRRKSLLDAFGITLKPGGNTKYGTGG